MEFWLRFQFNAGLRRNLYQSFADYLKQHMPLNDIVRLLAASIEKANAKSQLFLVKILKDVELSMSTGVEFADAMAKWIPASEATSIRAGMRSGDPLTGMLNTIAALDAAQEMASTLKSKLTYPVFLIVALFALIYFFSTSIVPQIAEAIEPEKWPDEAKPLYNMSQFVQEKWWVVVAVIVGLIVVVKNTLPSLSGPIRVILDKFPPYNFYKAFIGSSMLISLAALMKSGIPLVEAIEEIKTLSSPYLRKHLDRFIGSISEGKNLGEAMNTGLFSSEMMVNIYMMSHNADFQNAISSIGTQAVKKSIAQISTISSSLNSLIMLGVAGYVGWVYFCFYKVMSSLQNQL